MNYADSIQRQQNIKDFVGNTEDVYDILNYKSKGQPKPSERVQLEEASNNDSAHADALAKGINQNESQIDRNGLVSSHGESNN